MTAIVTKRLQLIKPMMAPSMIECMVSWLNDPEIVRCSEQRHHKHTVETQLEYLRHGFGRLRYIIAGDAFIGTIAAHVDENNSVANVGILIGEKTEWGKGYGTEAWQAFCDHLLANGIRKIEAGCMSCNSGMIGICRKTKMSLEGWRDEHFLLNGKAVHLMQWAKFA